MSNDNLQQMMIAAKKEMECIKRVRDGIQQWDEEMRSTGRSMNINFPSVIQAINVYLGERKKQLRKSIDEAIHSDIFAS